MTLRYRLDVADVHAHLYRVSVTVPRPDALQRLSLPVWIPGSYLVREFSRHLSSLQATQGSRNVELLQLDKATWEARCHGTAALTVSYLVYAFDNSVRAAWLDTRRGLVNGTAVFLRVHGREHEPHALSLGSGPGWPKGWSVATALAPQTLRADGRGDYGADDYEDFVDHPIEMGTFWRGGFSAAGVPHEFVVAGALPDFDGERLLADAKRICEAQIAFWHGNGSKAGGHPRPPFRRYVFLLNAVEDGYGGLEHRASTALIANRRDLPMRGVRALTDGYVTLLGLISHEYFHTWNVKRMRPREFTTLDYTRENYTPMLWFFEGFTSYYDDLFLLRSGLIDAPRYLKLVAKTVTQVLSTPGRHVQSVAQASFDAWVKYYRPDENTANATVSYYTKGALVALALDLTLRSEGRRSLDDVMRRLWTSSEGGPIDEDDIVRALSHEGRRDYAGELAAWVHGTADAPWQVLLEGHGIQWAHDAATAAQRLGLRLTEAGGALKVSAVMRGSAAEQAGLAAGDELLAYREWRVRRADDLTLLHAGEAPGALLVSRDQRLLTLTLDATPAPGGTVALALDAKPTAPALRRRKAWLGPSLPAAAPKPARRTRRTT